MTDDPITQLSPDSLDVYMRSGVVTPHILATDPFCQLVIDPRHRTLSLLTPAVGELPDVAGLRRVSAETLDLEAGPHFRLTIDAHDMHHEAYGMLLSIAQAMRHGASFQAASLAALGNLRALLAARARLSEQQQLGLVGELLVIDALLEDAYQADVLEWWLGPLAEQHDLALPGYDAEIKTTLSERRIHVISGIGQLEPNPGRALWLVSIQLTRAGGADGFSLPGLVERVRGRIGGGVDRLHDRLTAVGWFDDDVDLYPTRYLHRHAPAAYPVDTDFPAITPDRLHAVVPHPELVSAVSYRVDVTSRTPGDPGGPLHPFLDPKGDRK
jgi:hypothetical protein